MVELGGCDSVLLVCFLLTRDRPTTPPFCRVGKVVRGDQDPLNRGVEGGV